MVAFLCSLFSLLFTLCLSEGESGAGISYEQCPILNLNGLVFPGYSRRPVEHALHWSKAQSKLIIDQFVLIIITKVAKAAPDWNGTAVVGDPPTFKELKLSNFKGESIFKFNV